MLAFNVAQLLQALPGTIRTVSFSERLAALGDDLKTRGPVVGRVRLTRTSRGILVQARVRATVVLECGRCLEEVTAVVDEPLEEEFLPSTDIRTGSPLQVEPADVDQQWINEHHEVELEDLIRQTLLTALPLRPLCDAACAGLCATCGQRLGANHPEHSLPSENQTSPDVQTPFASLASLLNRADSQDAVQPEENPPTQTTRSSRSR